MISPSRVAAIAGNTAREAIRNRVLYTLLAFAVVMISAGMVLSNLSYVEQERILQSLGLSAIRIFGAAIAIAIGIGLIYREVERRTVYTILSKPISRSEFLLGKYLGLVATIWLQVGIMGAVFAAASIAGEAPLSGGHAAAIALTAVELAVVVAIATFFSTFTTPMLAALFTTGIYIASHLTRDLVELGTQSGVEGIVGFTRMLHRILPDLESFDLTIQAVHGLPITPPDVAFAAIYGAAYTVVVLMLAAAIFERRDFR